ncbi:MAG: FAD-dependent oxidoreductase [Egibacteraceae bacterium]
MASPQAKPRAVVVGGGPVGCLAARMLSQQGYSVDVYEKRPHFLDHGIADEGRTINLSVSPRGLHALAAHGDREEFLDLAVAMGSRALHTRDGRLLTMKYGETDWCNYSISRNELNCMLMRKTLRDQAVQFHFNAKCTAIDFIARKAFLDIGEGSQVRVSYDLLIGADGAFSAVREQMSTHGLLSFYRRELNSMYQEFTLWPAPNDRRLTSSAIHVWPRRGFFMVALPSREGSLRCTLVLPDKGTNSFAQMGGAQDVDQFFMRHFPDAAGSLRRTESARQHPVSSISVISCDTLAYEDSVLLMGDAAHTIAPFLGQGINLGLEDCMILEALLKKYPGDQAAALSEYERNRRVEGDAAAALSLANYVELSGTEGSAAVLRRRLTDVLHRLLRRQAEPPLAVTVNFLGLRYQEVLDRYRHRSPRRRPRRWTHSIEGADT